MRKKHIYISVFLIFFLSVFYIKSIPKEKILKIKKENFQEKILVSGVIKSPEIINISSEVSGKIIKIFKKEGDVVKKGDLLVELDNSQIRLKILQEEENLKKDLSQLNKLKTTDLDIAKSNFETSNLNFTISEVEYLKFKKLFDKNLITESEFNSKKLKYLSDKNTYIESKNRFDSITIGEEKKSLIINIESRKLSIENLQREFEKYTIFSPANGIITEKNIESKETISQFTPILELSAKDEKILEIDLDEKQISKIQLNDKIESFFPNDLSIKSSGNIFYIAPYVNKNNGTIKIKGTLINPPIEFLYNMNINGFIHGKKFEHVLIIPEDFLYLKDNKTFVYKKINGKNRLTEVKTFLNFSQKIIILEGLEENDIIVFPTEKIDKKLGFTHYE